MSLKPISISLLRHLGLELVQHGGELVELNLAVAVAIVVVESFAQLVELFLVRFGSSPCSAPPEAWVDQALLSLFFELAASSLGRAAAAGSSRSSPSFGGRPMKS